MFEVLEVTGQDRSYENTYRLISKHKTRIAADRKVEQLAKRDLKERWPHRPQYLDVCKGYYEVVFLDKAAGI